MIGGMKFYEEKGVHLFLKTQTVLDSFHNFEKAPDDRWYEIIQRTEGSFPKKTNTGRTYTHPPTQTHPRTRSPTSQRHILTHIPTQRATRTLKQTDPYS